MGIELDSNNDTITVHYYIDNEYVESLTKPLTTIGNGITSIYLSGMSVSKDTGIMLDDIVFGYSSDSSWIFDTHK